MNKDANTAFFESFSRKLSKIRLVDDKHVTSERE